MAKTIIYKTINNDGAYSCGDIGISTFEWYDLLLDKGAQQYLEALLCFLREPEHTGSCTVVSSKNGKPAKYYNGKITNFSKWVQKKLNRFSVMGTDGKDTYWCIVMKKGWESEQGFQWQMRDELVKALQNHLMHELIQDYKTKEPFNGKDEEYKWALLDEVEGKDIYGIIKCLRGKNVVYNEQVDDILKSLWETKQEELTTCFEHLLDETRTLIPRIEGFRDEMRGICPDEWKVCANDERTASAILTCRYPNDYTFYKNELYQVICKYFGFEYRSAFLKFEHFIEILNGFVVDFGEEIQQIMLPQIGKYRNRPLNLAVQTLLWSMKEEMKAAMRNGTSQSINDTCSPKIIQKNKYQEYIDLLEENKNLILTGAPGTGKTFMAKAIAEEMGAEVGFVQFHPSYDYTDFVEGLRPIEKDDGQIGFERKDGVFKEFCLQAVQFANKGSFEITDKDVLKAVDKYIEENCEDVLLDLNDDITIPSLSRNEKVLSVCDFWSGRSVTLKYLIPIVKSNKIFSSIQDVTSYLKIPPPSLLDEHGISDILSLYMPIRRLIDNKYNKPFVFVIDEINRGEISKIFGELFFAIDPNYRGEKGRVCTQYQNMIEDSDIFKNGFYVPENIYIIGTMNDIDRSVESMDFAMRRRFTWKEVTPSDTEYMLDTLDCAKKAKATMNRLNRAIEETEGLGAAYMIGPAYFLKLGKNGGDFVKLWKMNIEPLLKEYLRGFRKSSEILNKFSNAYFDKKKESGTDIPELIDED